MGETFEDILREMKETARMYLAGGNDSLSVFEILSTYHDRLDAAHKRDLKAIVDLNEIAMKTATDEVTRLREALYSDGDFGGLLKERDAEIERLNDAMSRVVGCADSTCGEMGVCRTCKVAQFTGGVK